MDSCTQTQGAVSPFAFLFLIRQKKNSCFFFHESGSTMCSCGVYSSRFLCPGTAPSPRCVSPIHIQAVFGISNHFSHIFSDTMLTPFEVYFCAHNSKAKRVEDLYTPSSVNPPEKFIIVILQPQVIPSREKHWSIAFYKKCIPRQCISPTACLPKTFIS